MKIAIISDIHDNLVNLEKALKWCKAHQIEELICCGDVSNLETLNFLANTFTGPIHLVRGNMEIFTDEDVERLENINYFGKHGKIELEGKEVGICHEPSFINKIVKDGPTDIIFYGHTHEPWEKTETRQEVSVRLVNPGTLGGLLAKASFAVWNTKTDKLELKIMEQL